MWDLKLQFSYFNITTNSEKHYDNFKASARKITLRDDLAIEPYMWLTNVDIHSSIWTTLLYNHIYVKNFHTKR
jgi:hypothetical protein